MSTDPWWSTLEQYQVALAINLKQMLSEWQDPFVSVTVGEYWAQPFYLTRMYEGAFKTGDAVERIVQLVSKERLNPIGVGYGDHLVTRESEWFGPTLAIYPNPPLWMQWRAGCNEKFHLPRASTMKLVEEPIDSAVNTWALEDESIGEEYAARIGSIIKFDGLVARRRLK